MAQVSKVVRFYRPHLIDKDDASAPFPDDYWAALRHLVDSQTPTQRRAAVNGDEYRGDTGLGVAPALRYFRIGRVRPPIDWPDTVDLSDDVAPLSLTNGKNLLENAYLVPFGTKNQVAIMNPIRGLVPIGAIESWMSAMLQLPPKGQSIELVPEIDKKVLKKLQEATGVASLNVRIPYDQQLEMPKGKGSVVEKAILGGDAAAGSLLDVEMTFTFGRRQATSNMAEVLRATTERLSRALGPDKLEVSMILEDGDGLKREHHNLLKDQIASTAKFAGDRSHQFSVDEILAAVAGAIEDFRSR